MISAFLNRLSRFGRHLSSMDDQPLGKAALAVVILLDIFIFFSIFAGLERHTGQLTDPYEYIPASCRDIVISGEWNSTNRLERLSRLVEARASSVDLPERPKERHPICVPLLRAIEEIADSKPLANAFQAYGRLYREARDVREKISDLKGPFDTALMESLAREEGRQIQAQAAGEELARETAKLDNMLRVLAVTKEQLDRDDRVSRLWVAIDGLTEATRQQLRDDLRSMTFWHPVKRIGMDLAFLLPLIVLLAFWNSASIRGGRSAQILVSSHLLVVTSLPVIFKVGELIYEIIPKKLLQQLIALLESLRLVALWHYLMMALAIVLGLWLIYIFQRKLFSREKVLARRISRGLCQQCGQSLAPGSAVCPLCGFNQYRTCPNCRKLTYVHGRFCRECGKELARAD
jgi:RNA polymerase subunit RPABC4/transcription elongation factor Spt4